MSPRRALFRRALRDSRTRTLSFALLFLFAVATQGPTYNATYDTLAERMELARTFGSNEGTRLLYGTPHDLLTTGGWIRGGSASCRCSPRCGACSARCARCAPRRSPGRQELVLAGVVGRGRAFLAAMARSAPAPSLLWLAVFLGALPGHVDVGGAAYLALRPARPRSCSPASERWRASSRRRAAARSGSAASCSSLALRAADGRRHVGRR